MKRLLVILGAVATVAWLIGYLRQNEWRKDLAWLMGN
jgi:hypothetical protein